MKHLIGCSCLLVLVLLPACRLPGSPAPPSDALTPPAATSTDSDSPIAAEATGTEGDNATAEPSGQEGQSSAEEGATATATLIEPTATVADPLAAVDPAGQAITLWYPPSDAPGALWELFAQEFNERNEHGIMVEVATSEGNPDLYSGMLTALQQEAIPNLVVADSGQVAAYHALDSVVELTPYIQSTAWGLPDEGNAASTVAGMEADTDGEVEQPAFPVGRSTTLLYYNAALLKELGFDTPPADWQAFEQMACAAAEAGKIGYQMETEEGLSFLAIIYSRGGKLLAEDGRTFNLSTPEITEAMAYLQGLAQQGCATLANYDELPGGFGEGEVLFTIDVSDSLPAYQQAAAGGYAGEWGIAALPHNTPEPVQLVSGANLAMTSGSPEAQLAAWLFIRWMAQPEQQARWVRETNHFPARQEAMAHLDAYLQENPQYEAAFELLHYSHNMPAVPGFHLVRLLIQDGLAQIIEGAAVDETLEDLTEEANSALAALQP